MKVILVSILALALAMPATAGQESAIAKKRSAGSSSGARFRVVGCTVSGTMLSGRIGVTPTPEKMEANDEGVDFDIATGPNGAPAISARAINTKGTGATLREAPMICATDAAPVGRRIAAGAVAGIAVASCSVEENGDETTASFSLPLSAFGASAKTGHVTLMKRGDTAAGATVVAQCSASKPMRASWDLATLKK